MSLDVISSGPYMVPGSDAAIKKIAPPVTGEANYWHDLIKGLHLRILPTGSYTWRFQYRNAGGVRRKITIGTWPAVTLAKAVTAAQIAAGKIAAGLDPAAERNEARKAARGDMTFREAVETYLSFRKAAMAPATYDLCKRHLLLQSSRLHSKSLKAIEVQHVVALLDDVADKHGDVTSNRLRSSLATMMKWCAGRAMAPASIVFEIRLIPKRHEQAEDRFLSIQELTAIWQATSAGTAYDRIVRLLMLTACRRSEIAGLQLSEFGAEWISIPPERTKTGIEHMVPRLPLIDRQLPEPTSPYLFGGEGVATFQGWSGGLQRLRNKVNKIIGAPAPSWSLHDLRRTFSTLANEHGLAKPHIIETVLGHSVQGVAAVYNRAEHREARRDALAAWHAFLIKEGVIDG